MKGFFRLPFGDGFVELEYDMDNIIGILHPKMIPASCSEEELILKALAKPIDSAPLREIVKRGEKVCIIFSDMTRLWVRHHLFMPFLLRELKSAGIKEENIFAICANGDHRDHTEEEFRKILGEEALRREYTIGGHMAFHTCLIAEKFKVFLFSTLPESEVKKTGMEPISSLREGVKKAKALLGGNPSTYIILEGHKLLPIFRIK